MPTLAITQDTISVRLEQFHLELINRPPSGDREAPNVRLHVPLHDVDRVVLIGCPGVSIAVLHRLMKMGIPVSFVSAQHRWLGSLSSENPGNAERRILQYKRCCDETFRLFISSELISCKIRNSRRVLQRLSAPRNESSAPRQIRISQDLEQLQRKVEAVPSGMDELRGLEGLAAALYFERLSDFFPPELPFEERSRQPPRNEANSLLSWTYSIVLGELFSQIRIHGLDPYIGVLHATSFHKPSLALDLLELFRAPLCDMLVMHLLNHKILRKEHFIKTVENGVYLKPEARALFFPSYESAMTRMFTVKAGTGHTCFRSLLERQVLMMIRILEEQKEYEFFRMP